MTVEERLKDLILSKFKSLREFSIAIDMPYSTIQSILKRGLTKAGIDNINKISGALGISSDGLANGEIVPMPNGPTFTDDDLMFALLGGAHDMDADDLAAVRSYAAFLKERKERAKKE